MINRLSALRYFKKKRYINISYYYLVWFSLKSSQIFFHGTGIRNTTLYSLSMNTSFYSRISVYSSSPLINCQYRVDLLLIWSGYFVDVWRNTILTNLLLHTRSFIFIYMMSSFMYSTILKQTNSHGYVS